MAQTALRLLFLALVVLATVACANPRPTALAATPNTDGVLRLGGRFAFGHACPLSENIALTSAHVTDLRPFDQDLPAWPLTWSDGLGHEGVLLPVSVSRWRDLAVMRTTVPFARWYPVASTAPSPGDRLWTIGYDWRRLSDLFGPREFSTTLLRIVARTLVLRDPTSAGASGACILNARGEVVGINMGHVPTEDGQRGGLAVAIHGEQLEEEGRR